MGDLMEWRRARREVEGPRVQLIGDLKEAARIERASCEHPLCATSVGSKLYSAICLLSTWADTCPRCSIVRLRRLSELERTRKTLMRIPTNDPRLDRWSLLCERIRSAVGHVRGGVKATTGQEATAGVH